jgi:hypothetical protein
MSAGESKLIPFAARLDRIEKVVGEICDLLKSKHVYNRKQRENYRSRVQRRLEQRRAGKLKNPDSNCLTTHDIGLRTHYKKWAKVGFLFGRQNKPYQFLDWLAFHWNTRTYWEKVMTRSGGYYHVFVGWSDDKPLRVKFTEADIFGNVKTLTSAIKIDQFISAQWWGWGYSILFQTISRMQQSENEYQKLSNVFLRPLLLMCGAFGEVPVRGGSTFDPNEADLGRLSKTHRYVKADLDNCWRACRTGLSRKVEPYENVVDSFKKETRQNGI